MKLRGIKLVIFDLDGTLLNNQGQLTKNSIDMLLGLKKHNIKICIASGRHNFMINHLPFHSIGVDYYISSNGAALYDANQEVIADSYMNADLTNIVSNSLNKLKVDYILYGKDQVLYNGTDEKIKSKFTNQKILLEKLNSYNKVDVVDTAISIDYSKIEKLVIYYASAETVANVSSKLIPYREEIIMAQTGDDFYSILDINSNKGFKVKKLMQSLDIKADEVVACGDFDNDLSMFEEVKYKVVPSNGTPALKAMATYISKSNNEDGIAKAIDYLILSHLN